MFNPKTGWSEAGGAPVPPASTLLPQVSPPPPAGAISPAEVVRGQGRRRRQTAPEPARGGTASSPQGLRYLNAALPYLTALIAQTPSQHAQSRPSAIKSSPQIQTA